MRLLLHGTKQFLLHREYCQNQHPVKRVQAPMSHASVISNPVYVTKRAMTGPIFFNKEGHKVGFIGADKL